MPYESSIIPVQAIQYQARVHTATNGRYGSNLYLHRAIYRAGEVIQPLRAKIVVPRDSVIVFSDDEPLKNWGHKCRYLMHDPSSGIVTDDIPSNLPPNLNLTGTFHPFHLPTAFARTEGQRLELPHLPPRTFLNGASDWYAILYSGASMNRHLNDLEFLYRTLVNVYAFLPGNIVVLNFDGTLSYNDQNWQPVAGPIGNWPGDNSPYQIQIDGSGTKAELLSAIAGIGTKMGSNGKLLLHTNNHGDRTNGTSTIVSYQGDDTAPSDLASALSALPQFDSLLVMMEQCYSGGFIDSIISASTANRTSVATAVDAVTSSDGGDTFDPFALAWISGMAGINPDGSSLAASPVSSSGCVSAGAAFQYAKANDTGTADNPQFQQNNSSAGAVCLNDNRVPVQVPQNFRFLPPPPQGELPTAPSRLLENRLTLHRRLFRSLSGARDAFLADLQNHSNVDN